MVPEVDGGLVLDTQGSPVIGTTTDLDRRLSR
jgi:hypothetical protein